MRLSEPQRHLLDEVDFWHLALESGQVPQPTESLLVGRDPASVALAATFSVAQHLPAIAGARLWPRGRPVGRVPAGQAQRLTSETRLHLGHDLLGQEWDVDLDEVGRHVDADRVGHVPQLLSDAPLQLAELLVCVFHLDGHDAVVGKEPLDVDLALLRILAESQRQPAQVIAIDPDVFVARLLPGPFEDLPHRLLVADVGRCVPVDPGVGVDPLHIATPAER